jgi:hypothetical protein
MVLCHPCGWHLRWWLFNNIVYVCAALCIRCVRALCVYMCACVCIDILHLSRASRLMCVALCVSVAVRCSNWWVYYLFYYNWVVAHLLITCCCTLTVPHAPFIFAFATFGSAIMGYPGVINTRYLFLFLMPICPICIQLRHCSLPWCYYHSLSLPYSLLITHCVYCWYHDPCYFLLFSALGCYGVLSSGHYTAYIPVVLNLFKKLEVTSYRGLCWMLFLLHGKED